MKNPEEIKELSIEDLKQIFAPSADLLEKLQLTEQRFEQEIYAFLFRSLKSWLEHYTKREQSPKDFEETLQIDNKNFSVLFEDVGDFQTLIYFHINENPAFTAILELEFTDEGLLADTLFAEEELGIPFAFEVFQKVLFDFDFGEFFEIASEAEFIVTQKISNFFIVCLSSWLEQISIKQKNIVPEEIGIATDLSLNCVTEDLSLTFEELGKNQTLVTLFSQNIQVFSVALELDFERENVFKEIQKKEVVVDKLFSVFEEVVEYYEFTEDLA